MSGRIRIVILIDSLLAGGAERVAVESACALDRSQFDPHVLVSRGSGPLAASLDRAGIPYTLLERRRRFDARAWLRALRLVRGFDLLHAHKFGSAVWGSLLARLARVPLVVHDHNHSNTESRLRAMLERLLIGPVAQRILCVSQPVHDRLVRAGLPTGRVAVLHNGVRLHTPLTREQARIELGLTSHEQVIGIVAGLRPEKAHEVLLTAHSMLATASHTPPRLCIVGDGPERAHLEQLATHLGLSGHVTFAGERADAARLAPAFDVAVICSDWEGLPLAALEALAAEVPLVATAVGGLPELLQDDAGLLVPVRDPQALAEGISHLLSDSHRAARIAAVGRARVEARHDFDQMVRALEQLYTSLARRQWRGGTAAPTGKERRAA